MKRDDILTKAQLEKNDEREEQIAKHSFRYGWIAVNIVILLLVVLRRINNENSLDLAMILMAQGSAVSFYQYSKGKEKKSNLFFGILTFSLVIIGFIVLFKDYGMF